MHNAGQRATMRRAHKNAPRPARPANAPHRDPARRPQPDTSAPKPGTRQQRSALGEKRNTPQVEQHERAETARHSSSRTGAGGAGGEGNLVTKNLGADSPLPRGAGAAAVRESTRRAGSERILAWRKQDAQGAGGERGRSYARGHEVLWIRDEKKRWVYTKNPRGRTKRSISTSFQKLILL